MFEILDLKFLCLLSGAVAGTIRSVLGWLDSGEKFQPRLFSIALLRTIIVGAMLGYGANQDPFAVFFQVYFTDSLLSRALPAVKGGGTK